MGLSFSARMRARMAKRTDEVAATTVIVPNVVKPIELASVEARQEVKDQLAWDAWQAAFAVILARQVARYGMMG